jgi:hypothetical protein
MAAPKYADTPWWSNLLAVLITAIVSVLGTLYAMRVRTPGAPATPSVGSFFTDTLTYIPHIMLLFGILADMFTYQGVYSIPSLIGLLSIPLNFVMAYFWAGISDFFSKISQVLTMGPAAPVNPREAIPGRNILSGGGGLGEFFKNYDGCDVQGFSALHSPYAPQTLVVTATVFAYYIFDLIQNRGWTNASAAIVMFLVLFGGQVFAIGNCAVNDEEPGRGLKALAAFAEGLLFGGIGYGVVQSYFPGRLPSTVISPFPKKTAEDLKPGTNGTFSDENGNPYICLPNGQCYPDLSTTESRKAFADIAAENLGTGSPAVPADCEATPE